MVGKLGLDVSPQICSIVLGALMLVTAILGFDGVKWVNYIAAPLLFIICAYGPVCLPVQYGHGHVDLPTCPRKAWDW